MQKNKKDNLMLRLIIIAISILVSSVALAKSNYQVDLIIFAHPHNAAKTSALDLDSPLLPINKDAIRLSSQSNKLYGLLPASRSGLNDEYYRLHRTSQYQVLGHYSWIQPGSNQSTVALPSINTKGWQMQGTVRVRQSNYYLFDAELQFSPPSNPQASFTISQKQRLKGSVVYYLDHPQIGMLLKIHRLA